VLPFDVVVVVVEVDDGIVDVVVVADVDVHVACPPSPGTLRRRSLESSPNILLSIDGLEGCARSPTVKETELWTRVVDCS
jgi:hypothetical protein